MKLLTAILTLLVCFSYAQESDSQWKHESEASVVTTSGNTKTQTFSVKETTSYKINKNIFENKASYLVQKDRGNKQAENWMASLRYEREISSRFNIFLAETVDSDKFSSIYRRYSSDLGGKYFFIKEDDHEFFSELGYRYTYEDYLAPQKNEDLHFGRLYLEHNKKWTAAISSKVWTEFLPNFTESKDYRFNAEPSMSVMLSEVFSLKIAYLLKYRGKTPPGVEDLDTIYTTSIVAKF